MSKQELSQMERQFNKILQLPQLQALLPRSPNMRYWKQGTYVYGWTTQPIGGKFYALKYRVLKNGSWSLKRKARFGRRKVAKARARKWLEEVS
jgi:hypothetical protein